MDRPFTLTHALILLLPLLLLFRRLRDWHQLHTLSKSHRALPPPESPGSRTLGFTNFLGLLKAARRGTAVDFLSSVYGTHNTIGRHFFTEHIYSTIEPANVKALLATQFKSFELGPNRYPAFSPLLGDGIFTLDGHGWETSRALLRPQFSREQISDLEALEEQVRLFFSLLPTERGGEVDLQPLFYKLTLDTATEFLFGEPAGSLKGGRDEFAEDFNEAQQWLMWRFRMKGLAKIFQPKRAEETFRRVHAFVDRYVDLALLPPEKRKPVKRNYVFLHALAQETQDRKLLRDQMLNILLAGRDTTAGLLGWTWYLLAQNPEKYAKLRAAVRESFWSPSGNCWQQPTFETLKATTYLRHVINESLRLYPVVPFNSRIASGHTVLPTGGGPDGRSPLLVPKGKRVNWSVPAMHRRKDIFGEDAQVFRPERWLEEKAKKWGWEYLPFNGGPRICLGQQFAITEVGFVIARMCMEIERVERLGSEEDKGELTLSWAPKKLNVRVWRE